MTLDLNRYRSNIPALKTWLETKSDVPLSQLVGEFALATNCHLVVICHYVKELRGSSDELEILMSRLKQFYKITSVINEKSDIL